MASPRSGERPPLAFGVLSPRWRNRAALRWDCAVPTAQVPCAVYADCGLPGRPKSDRPSSEYQTDPRPHDADDRHDGEASLCSVLGALALGSGSGLWLWALHVPCPAGGRVNCQQCLIDIRRRHPSSLNCTARFAPASRPAFCSGTRCARVDGRRGARRRRAAVRVRRCLCSPRLRQASDLPGRAASQ